MRLSSSGLLVLLASSTLTDALPFIPDARSNRPLARRKATYSVVPVDGGSTRAAAATTVTQPASTLPPVTETELATLFSTRVVTAYETASTVVVTITATPLPPSPPSSTVGPIAPTSTPSCSEITTTTTTTSETIQVITGTGTLTSATAESTESTTTTTTVNTTAAVVSMTTISPQVVTVTATPSSTAYDDGMWHTTYYYPVYETSLSSSSAYPYTSTVTSSSTASPSLGTNIGVPWNGTLALSP